MSNENITEHNCPICLEMLTLDNNYCKTSCDHTYRTSGLLQVKGCCPMCRHELVPQLTPALLHDEQEYLEEELPELLLAENHPMPESGPYHEQVVRGALFLLRHFRADNSASTSFGTRLFASRILNAYNEQNKISILHLTEEYKNYRTENIAHLEEYDLYPAFSILAESLQIYNKTRFKKATM